MAQNKTGFDPTQTAEDWLERKIYTIPLRARSKRPKTDNWPRYKLTLDKIPGAFNIGDNIGALWGETSNWVVDVDLDIEEACEVAPYILPPTFMYGRRGKPGSHYLYRCIEAETRKWQVAKDVGVICELRSSGTQSVIPPSIHPDGGRYYIEEGGEIYSISKAQLYRLLDEVAIAALFLKYYPDSGSRHDYVHACTGTLCHAQWGEDKIKRVMGAVLSCIEAEEDEIRDRIGSVINTIEHFKIGDRVQGFTTLETWMEIRVVSQIKRWSRSGTQENRLVMEPPMSVVPSKSETSFDDAWLTVPGLVGDISRWAAKSSYIEQPSFSLATGIMCMALATCNKYLINVWDTPLQPYLMITAPTGDGKGAVLQSVARFAMEVGLEDFVFRGFQSYYSMLDELANPPSMAMWLWDEAARHMASAKRASTVEFQTLSHVISLYGQGGESLPGTPGRKQAIPPLEHPFLTVLATAQPDQLMEALTSVAEETGFVNRFILFDSGNDYPSRNRQRSKVFPRTLKIQIRAMRELEPRDGDFTKIRFDSKAWALFESFEEMCRRRSHRGEKVWARGNQNALILAGLAAVGVDPVDPLITEDLGRWAQQVTAWSNDCWTEKVRMVGGDSIIEKESFRVEERIKHPFKYLGSATTEHQRSLCRQGYLPETVLRRLTRSIRPLRLREILDDLHDADLVSTTDKDGQTCYYHK